MPMASYRAEKEKKTGECSNTRPSQIGGTDMTDGSAPSGQYVGGSVALQVPPIVSAGLDRRRVIKGREAAELVGVTLRTLRRYAELGLVPGAYRVGTGHWRYKRRELLDWWDKLQGAAVRH